ncbi:hypothetical protein Btru_034363 [Bulinus truncatus]|nr:hypothetical protein Btru_034363 [Bulinus truncatus]
MNCDYCAALFSWQCDSHQIFTNDQIALSCTGTQDEDSSKNCFLNLFSLKPDLVKINGFIIVSESRTLEISNITEGYLSTVRGNEFRGNAETSESDNHKLYLCKCYFEDKYLDISIKFLSLGEKSSFFIRSLTVYLSKNEDFSTYRSPFDIQKLEKEIELMGDTVSDKARDFLKTFQQFQKNKVKTQPCHVISHQSSGPSLLGLVNSSLGFDTALALFQGAQGKSFRCDNDSDLYAILQGVCGDVSKQREESRKAEEVPQTPDSVLDSFSASCARSTEDPPFKDHLQILDTVDEKINQIKNDFQEALIKAQQEMNEKLEETKNGLNQKLDLILTILNSQSLTDVNKCSNT